MSINGNKKVLPFTVTMIIIVSIISTLLITITDTVKADDGGTIYTIWLPTDPQIATDVAEYNYTLWDDAVNDANNVSVNISFVIGDCIQGYSIGNAFNGNWNEPIWDWLRFYEYFDNLNTDIYKNITIGNHDIWPATGAYPYPVHYYSWKNHSRIDNTTSPLGNYTWTWGNIMFIMLATENEGQPGGEDGANYVGFFSNQTDWFESTVENNTDKNIIVLSHYPLVNTSFPGNLHVMKASDSALFNATITANDHVTGFFNGHVHDNGGSVCVYENCTYVDCNGVNGYHGRTSVFLYIQEGNATVEVKGYNHVTNAFASYGDLPTTFNLKYNFTLTLSNQSPTFSSPHIANESTGVSMSESTWNVTIEDPEGDTINWTIETYPDIGDNSGNDDTNGSKSVTLLGITTNTTYTVYINATDSGSGNWTNSTYWFTIESVPTIDSINNKNNGGTSVDVYRNISWYKVENAVGYQLQISNTSDYTDLLYNVSYINSTNYGAEYYQEIGNTVYFNISNIFDNEIYVAGLTHYYRVRAIL